MHDWFEAEAAAERAQQFYENGQWDQALAALDLALSVNPEQSDWHMGKGLTLDAMRRYDEAARAFEQVVRLRGDQVEPLLRLGVDLTRSGEPARAIEVLQRALQLDPHHHAAQCQLILAYARAGDHDAAEQAFYLAQQQDESCAHCFDHIAHSLAERGELDRAEWCWRQARTLSPQVEDVALNLARVAWRRGRLDASLDLYLDQLRDDPGDIEALIECGRLLRQLNRHAEAAEKFRRIVELDPTQALAHYQLGELALRAGHLDAAASGFETAGRLAPELPGVHLNLAAVALRRGRADLALQHLIAELDVEGQSGPQVLDLARMLITLDAPAEAVDLLTPLLDGTAEPLFEDDGTLASALVLRGVALAVRGDTAAAIGDLRLALRMEPGHPVATYNLIVAYLDGRSFRRARAVLRRAMRAAPNDGQLQRLSLRLRREAWVQRLAGLLRRIR